MLALPAGECRATEGQSALASAHLLPRLCPDCLCQRKAKLFVLPAGCATVWGGGEASQVRRVPVGSACMGRNDPGMARADVCGIQVFTSSWPCFRARWCSCSGAEGRQWAAWCCLTAICTLVLCETLDFISNSKCCCLLGITMMEGASIHLYNQKALTSFPRHQQTASLFPSFHFLQEKG